MLTIQEAVLAEDALIQESRGLLRDLRNGDISHDEYNEAHTNMTNRELSLMVSFQELLAHEYAPEFPASVQEDIFFRSFRAGQNTGGYKDTVVSYVDNVTFVKNTIHAFGIQV